MPEPWLKTATFPDLAEQECHSAGREGSFLRIFELLQRLELERHSKSRRKDSTRLRERSPNSGIRWSHPPAHVPPSSRPGSVQLGALVGPVHGEGLSGAWKNNGTCCSRVQRFYS